MILDVLEKPFAEVLTDFFDREVCNKQRKEECKLRSGPYLEKLCQACELRKEEPNLYLNLLSQMFLLSEAGFSFGNNDMSFQMWNDFALFSHFAKAKMQPFG